QASPVYVNGVIYTGDSYDGNVLALDAKTGATIWNYTTGSFTQYYDVVTEHEANTGNPLSGYVGNYTISGVYGNAVANNVEYSGALDNKTYALNAQTGALIWSYQTNGNIYSAPTVANGVLYFGSDDHNVYAVGQASGGSAIANVPGIVYIAVAVFVVVVVVVVALMLLRKRLSKRQLTVER